MQLIAGLRGTGLAAAQMSKGCIPPPGQMLHRQGHHSVMVLKAYSSVLVSTIYFNKNATVEAKTC